MRVFKEIQAFGQWWLLLILGISNANFNLWDIGSFFLVIMVGLLELNTKIDAKGISARFKPFPFFKRNYSWNEISECYVRQYSTLNEYGGWGIRGLRKAKA